MATLIVFGLVLVSAWFSWRSHQRARLSVAKRRAADARLNLEVVSGLLSMVVGLRASLGLRLFPDVETLAIELNQSKYWLVNPITGKFEPALVGGSSLCAGQNSLTGRTVVTIFYPSHALIEIMDDHGHMSAQKSFAWGPAPATT